MIAKEFVSEETSISATYGTLIAFPDGFIPNGYKIAGSNISGTGNSSCIVRAVTGQGINVQNFSSSTQKAIIKITCLLLKM